MWTFQLQVSPNMKSIVNHMEKRRKGLLKTEKFYHGYADHRCSVLTLSKFQDVESTHTAAVNSLDIETVDGRYILSGSADGAVFIHDLYNFTGLPRYTCKAVAKIQRNHRHAHKYSVECVQWYPHDTGLFTSSSTDRYLKIWDSNILRPAEKFVMEGKIFQHQMSPVATKHSLIAVASTINQVLLVDLKSGSHSHELRGHRHAVTSCQWSTRDENLLATGCADGRILMWDVRSSRSCLKNLDRFNGELPPQKGIQRTAHQGLVNGLTFTPDGIYLLSLGKDGNLYLWDMFSFERQDVCFGKVVNESKRNIKLDTSASLPYRVYVPSGPDILEHNINTGDRDQVLVAHYNMVNCCSFHPFHQELFSGGNDRNILVWKADHEQTFAYQSHLNQQKWTEKRTVEILNHGITADTWSSDEDD